MSDSGSKTTSSGIGLGGLIFVVFLIMKLTEKCNFWGDAFPRILKSTDAWWDGWFMVFLPLILPIIVALIFLGVGFIIAYKKDWL